MKEFVRRLAQLGTRSEQALNSVSAQYLRQFQAAYWQLLHAAEQPPKDTQLVKDITKAMRQEKVHDDLREPYHTAMLAGKPLLVPYKERPVDSMFLTALGMYLHGGVAKPHELPIMVVSKDNPEQFKYIPRGDLVTALLDFKGSAGDTDRLLTKEQKAILGEPIFYFPGQKDSDGKPQFFSVTGAMLSGLPLNPSGQSGVIALDTLSFDAKKKELGAGQVRSAICALQAVLKEKTITSELPAEHVALLHPLSYVVSAVGQSVNPAERGCA